MRAFSETRFILILSETQEVEILTKYTKFAMIEKTMMHSLTITAKELVFLPGFRIPADRNATTVKDACKTEALLQLREKYTLFCTRSFRWKLLYETKWRLK